MQLSIGILTTAILVICAFGIAKPASLQSKPPPWESWKDVPLVCKGRMFSTGDKTEEKETLRLSLGNNSPWDIWHYGGAKGVGGSAVPDILKKQPEGSPEVAYNELEECAELRSIEGEERENLAMEIQTARARPGNHSGTQSDDFHATCIKYS